MSTPAVPKVTRIADLSYRNYDGPRRAAGMGWWTIATMTMRMNIRKVAFWIPIGFIILWALFLILAFFFTNRIGAEQLKISYANILYQCVCGDWTLLMLMLLGLVVGSGAIAADTQANALLVYFARPLSKLEYVFGKWVGVFLMLFSATFLPALLIYLYFLAAYTSDGFFKQDPILLLRTLGASLVAPAIDTSLILGFSALSRTGRVAGASFAIFYLLLGVLTNVLGITAMENARMDDDMDRKVGNRFAIASTTRRFNVVGITDGIGLKFFRLKPYFGLAPDPRMLQRRPTRFTPPILAPLVATGSAMVIVPLILITWRIRAVEVVSG
ncbi:MAG: ABC transporter permease subunit [Armatimonas sp.]